MYFRILAITIIVLILALIGMPFFSGVFGETITRTFSVRLDNLVIFSISIISFFFLTISSISDKRKLKKQLKDQKFIIEDLENKLKLHKDSPEPVSPAVMED